jgi:hypothetical protein
MDARLLYPLKSVRRSFLKDYSQGYKKLIAGASFTILSIHRVFPIKVVPNVDTIVDPFSALSKSWTEIIF